MYFQSREKKKEYDRLHRGGTVRKNAGVKKKKESESRNSRFVLRRGGGKKNLSFSATLRDAKTGTLASSSASAAGGEWGREGEAQTIGTSSVRAQGKGEEKKKILVVASMLDLAKKLAKSLRMKRSQKRKETQKKKGGRASAPRDDQDQEKKEKKRATLF